MATEVDAVDGGATADEPAGDGEPSERAADLAARVELLEAENERLRREYRRATQVTYRRTALALAGLGVLALLGAGLFPATRTVFVVLGAIGLFGGVLTYYLTPERVLAASVAQHLASASRRNLDRAADELGLQDTIIYHPVEDGSIRAFRPQHPDADPPDTGDRLFVVSPDDRDRGVDLVPPGRGLFEAFETARSGPSGETAATAADQLADAVVEQFELAAGAVPEAAPADGRVTVGITDPAITPLADAHHPIASFLATGLAAWHDGPVRVTVDHGDERFDATVRLEWDTSR